jgi:hypothetical protein
MVFADELAGEETRVAALGGVVVLTDDDHRRRAVGGCHVRLAEKRQAAVITVSAIAIGARWLRV